MIKCYEIGFEEEKEFIILSETSIHNIITAVQNGHSDCIKVNIELLLPAGYAEYISNVINANRELELFQFNYIRKKEINFREILLILKRQISLLIINNAKCFTSVSFWNIGIWGHFILEINPAALLFLKDKKKEICIQKYNRNNME